jgi:hypothetical protein
MGTVTKAKRALPTDSFQKHTSAIHVIGDIGLLERKLINVLLLNAFEDLHIEGHTHTLPVVALLEGVDWTASKNIDTIKDALLRIQRVTIVFDALAKEPKKSKWAAMPVLGYAGIEGGILSYRYDKALSNLLAKPDSYAIINVNIQNEFESAYALALYENCYRFYKTGSTGWIPVETWRGLLNAQNELYNEFKYFNQRVLQDAIKTVNAVSNIVIEMEVEREKRAVKKIRFKVTLKSQLMLADQAGPSDNDLREQPLFAELTEWVGARLALQWMRDDRERAEQVVARVKYMASRDEIRKTKGGLARSLFEGGGPIETVPDEKKPEPSKVPGAPTEADHEKTERTRATQAAVASLTSDERAAIAAEFIAQQGIAANYDAAKDKVGDLITTRKYRDFTRARAADVIANRG